MTPEAKKPLSSTVRALRARRLGDLQAAMETEYRLGVPRLRDAGLGEATVRHAGEGLDQPGLVYPGGTTC